MSNPTLELPFDQYQRYRLVADIVGSLRRGRERLDILDVGGRTALLRRFLPKDKIHLVDVEESEERGLVLGDGSRLPFADDCVDAVVTFDTLEHVPPSLREDFLKECRRVARRWVIVAGPYATEGVEQAERVLETFLKGKMGVEHRYLAEHKKNGLPSLKQSEELLGGKGAKVKSIGHASLTRWLALMCLELYMDRDPQLRAIAAKYYQFYNGVLYASDHAAPVYRHAVVAVYDGSTLPSQSTLLDDPVAPEGSFKPFAALIKELVEFDVQRDIIIVEWERLEKVNADLHSDLEGHRSSLLLLEENNQEQIQVIEELRERVIDLVSNEELLVDRVEELTGELRVHSERADHAEAALEGEKERVEEIRSVAEHFEAEVEVRDKAITEVTAGREELEGRLDAANITLGENQQSLDLVREELANQREVVEARDRTIVELIAGREELEKRLNAANITAGEKQRSLDLVRVELTNQRRINEALQASLRDRWASLLRALGLK